MAASGIRLGQPLRCLDDFDSSVVGIYDRDHDFEAAAAVLPMRPRLPRPLLCDVAGGRFNFAVPVTDVLICGLHFNLTGLRKPVGESVSE